MDEWMNGLGFMIGGKRECLLGYSVWIAKRTAIEIVWDALPARGVLKGSTVAGDSEE